MSCELHNIIKENVKWFWNNDPMVEYETDMEKLWNAFKVWCVQNCKEIFDNLDESCIECEIDSHYYFWEENFKRRI